MSKSESTRLKNCFCHTCNKAFHSLGIARHRTMHYDKGEPCIITFKDGRTQSFKGQPSLFAKKG